ncbi:MULTISPECIES: response regulator [Nannocystis]|jgi:CheY-like chemotaxis protein|uniref:Response regulator n=1 Tax=Nannocystis radixulma TaxID=2995305 RepID=A0ABT5BC12_9BACT|nr:MULTISPECIES: response regulator [Nannocystis]MCY1062998.1 response regulator [Nannocystis sp. SCPEA4]MDC0671185.1 response regulator [Nannocystis radixulma]
MSEPRHVVVADPDPRERARVQELLRVPADELGLALEVHAASDGQVALALIEQRKPALVLSEVLLEGLSGLSILRRLRATLPPGKVPPFVFITTMARESDRYWGLRNGAHGYVMKPYEDDLLQSRIRDVLREVQPEKLGIL